MKRYNETELDKIVRIGLCLIDQVIDNACDELEGIKPKPEVLRRLRLSAEARGMSQSEALFRQQAAADASFAAQNALLNRGLAQSQGANCPCYSGLAGMIGSNGFGLLGG